MAITSLDGAIAGMQPPKEFINVATPTLVAGRPHSLVYLAGLPGASTPSSAGMSGESLTSWAGAIPFTNPTSGNTYLARFAAQATIAGQLLLLDRLWQNSGTNMTITTPQTVTSVAFPARDASGSSNGDSVLLGVEVTAATGAGTPTITISYTNEAGVSGRTATNAVPTVASSAQGAFYLMGLQAGDKGVRSVESITLSTTWTSGSISIVAFRIIARLAITGANTPASIDALTAGFPRMFNNSVPFLVFIPSTTTATTVNGHIVYTQG